MIFILSRKGEIEIMKENSCIFCKLANGEIPSATIYEDEDFRCFLDLNPASRGHALLVPKEHFANLFEMDREHLERAMVLAQRIGAHMKEKLGCDGLNLVQNNGEAAGLPFPSASDSAVSGRRRGSQLETGQPYR